MTNSNYIEGLLLGLKHNPSKAFQAGETEAARRSPANLASYVSEGRWKPYPHLRLVLSKFREAVEGPGKRIIVELPPQHGKSTALSLYSAAWFLGRWPDKRVILASYDTDYAQSWGRRVRELFEEYGRELFGLSINQASHSAGRWDIDGHEGGMTATGLGSSITGKRSDLMLVDDPIKNDEEAQSEVDREKKYLGYLTVVLTRLSQQGSIFIIMTRWHQDDLVGRLVRDMKNGTGEKFEVIRLPAIAEERETWNIQTPNGVPEVWTRNPGDALCPEMFTAETLRTRQAAMGEHIWARLYQQNPYSKSGGMFDVSKLRERICSHNTNAAITVRAWDLAATEKKTSKRTAGIKLSKNVDGKLVVEHVVLGKWTPDKRNEIMLSTARKDGDIKIYFEHEGGSSGEDQALSIARLLQGFRVEGIRVTGDKVTRADAVASQVNLGNVWIVGDGTWDVEAFLAELESFPNGTYLDQTDSLSLAANQIMGKNVEPIQIQSPECIAEDTRRDERGDEGSTPWDAIRVRRP